MLAVANAEIWGRLGCISRGSKLLCLRGPEPCIFGVRQLFSWKRRHETISRAHMEMTWPPSADIKMTPPPKKPAILRGYLFTDPHVGPVMSPFYKL